MQEVGLSGLSALGRDLERILNEMPEVRRELHEELAVLAKEEVDKAMPLSGLREHTGRVRGWQAPFVGSGGGYAAARPIKGKLPPNKKGKSYAFGQITNAIASGHTTRSPENSAGYRPRIRVGKVRGRPFYQMADRSFEFKAILAAEQFAEKLVQKLEGAE